MKGPEVRSKSRDESAGFVEVSQAEEAREARGARAWRGAGFGEAQAVLPEGDMPGTAEVRTGHGRSKASAGIIIKSYKNPEERLEKKDMHLGIHA